MINCEDLFIYFKDGTSAIFKGSNTIELHDDGLIVEQCKRVVWYCKENIDYFEYTKKEIKNENNNM